MQPLIYPSNLFHNDWQMPQIQSAQRMQPMAGAAFMDNQLIYMQPGMMNHQFMGYDPSGQHQVIAPQGFPMSPVDMQQQFYT
jgi:hypothetical protein